MATISAKRGVQWLAWLVGTALSEQLMKAGAVTARMRNDTTYCMLGEIENRNVLNYFNFHPESKDATT